MDINLDPTADRPVYRQLADALRSAIASGELKPGMSLPSERLLVEEHRLSRGTVRESFNLLKAEGLINTFPGKGAFVRHQLPIKRLASDRFARYHRDAGKGAYHVDLEAAQKNASVDRIEIQQEVAPPQDVSKRLGLDKHEKVAVRSRRYLADGEPVELAVSFIPWKFAKGTRIVEENTGPGGIYARIEEQGLRIIRYAEEISARMPNPDEARSLKMISGVPVLTIVRVAFAEGEIPVEECDTVMRADRYVLSYELPG